MIRTVRLVGYSIMAIANWGGPLAAEQGVTPQAPEQRAPVASRAATPYPVPFGPGEQAIYQVKFGIVSVGEGRLTVSGVDTVRGHPSYRLEMGIAGGLGPLKVNDLYQSWLDVSSLTSRRFIRDIHEISYKRRREWAIFPEEKRWERVDAVQNGETISSLPLDELAFVYYVRTLPLKVGETYNLNRYFRESGNPVVVKVLRKEVREVPAGTFNTIVVQPIIQTSGLFSEGGRAEIYFSDDDARHVVYLRSEISRIGSLTLHLKELSEGTPLTPSRSGDQAERDPPR